MEGGGEIEREGEIYQKRKKINRKIKELWLIEK